MQPPFWAGIFQRNRIKLDKWIDEQFDFLLQSAGLAVVYPVMRALRYYGIGEAGFWDIMQDLHEVGAVLIFGCWIFGMVRHRYASSMKDE